VTPPPRFSLNRPTIGGGQYCLGAINLLHSSSVSRIRRMSPAARPEPARGESVERTPRILVIRRRYLGDIVLLGPVFRNLRLHWPQARITALVEEPYAAVLALHPDVDSTLVFPRAARHWVQLLRALRSGRFTHVFDFDNTEKTALLTRLTGASFRIALYHGSFPVRLRRSYTHTAHHPSAEHETHSIAEYYLQTLPAAGVPVVTHDVRLVPHEADVAFVRGLLGRLPGAAVAPQIRRLLVHPGSRSQCRLWPPERFGEICRRVRGELEAKVVLIAGAGEEDVLRQVLLHAGAGQPVIDQPLSVPQLAALVTQFDLMLCHDSGPMHVAAAVGTRVVALLGSQNPVLFAPPGPGHTVLQPPLPCRNCVAPGICVPGDSYRNYCVRNIPVAQVFAAIRGQLVRPAAQP
jgi:ADP-heptose:LPS heptosyltransferase